MAYAQKDYPNVAQGIPPTRYTLAQTGCFITAFCNLLARFGRPVDPPALNAYLRDHNLFIDVDDGVRDDVSWDTVTKYDPNATVSAVGGASRPPNNDCIVKFIYNNGNSTHFCLVNDANAGTIIDSWDGLVKSWDVYGGVKAWASYNNSKAGGDPMADKSTIGDVEARILIKRFYGYTDERDIESAIPALVGGESNTVIRRMDATPTAAAYDKFLADLKAGAATGDSDAVAKLAQIKKIVG